MVNAAAHGSENLNLFPLIRRYIAGANSDGTLPLAGRLDHPTGWRTYLCATGAARGERLANHAAGKEKPVKQQIRTILFGTTTVTSIALTALIGCRSNDGGSSLAAKPDTGRVAKVTMKLSWPPGAAQQSDGSAGPPLPIVAAPPAKYPPIVYTQRP